MILFHCACSPAIVVGVLLSTPAVAVCRLDDIKVRQADWHRDTQNDVKVVGEILNTCSEPTGVKVEKIEGSDDTVRDQLLVRDEHQVDAVPVDRFSAHLVDPPPAWLGIDHQPEWGLRAIKYAVSDIERQTIERPSSLVIKSRHANDVVINAGGAHFETKILSRRIFQGKRLGERGIGAGTLAKTRQRVALELLFSNLAYIGADGEAEQMLGVDRVGTCDDRP
jgi:hypothetical protein